MRPTSLHFEEPAKYTKGGDENNQTLFPDFSHDSHGLFSWAWMCKGTLQATNSFPFPTVDIPSTDGHHDSNAASNLAAAAPRAKVNAAYQNEMIRNLREVNIDASNVGWYTSANMGNFVNLNMIENQYYYQKDLNERTVAIVHDVSRSSQGSLSLRAFRLSIAFMAAYKEGKFTTER